MIDVDGIKTYSNRFALDALAKLAAAIPAHHAIVEIGVYRGGSLRTIAQAATTNHVGGIDTWGLEAAYSGGSEDPAKYGIENMRIAEKAVEGLGVTLTRDYSVNAANNYIGPPIGLLYIDGEHTYEAVKADFNAWKRHLAPDAVVAFDDYTNKPEHEGLRAGVNELLTEGLELLAVHGGRLAVTRRV